MLLDNCTPTQPTQGTTDPRRVGSSESGLGDVDLADVLCILHPCSPAAFKIVQSTALREPHHVLQAVSASYYNDGLSPADLEEQETFIIDGEGAPPTLDLALRFSSPRINKALGFVFGRHRTMCDIVIDTDSVKRVSNIHFRIFVNQSGVCMLEDLSTNGTVVDTVVLKGKQSRDPATRMLNAGSIIEILSTKPDENVKFIMRIPSREGHMQEFTDRFNSYMHEVALAEAEQGRQQMHMHGTKAAYPRLAATGNLPMVRPPMVQNAFGMHWNGGDKYNVVGHLGKGAFATVYRLATKSDGQLFAAKELEKRRFMKNGILDRKLETELQIMREIDHPRVVQYIDYQDIANHLYIIMEYVPCGDLQQWLHLHGPLPEILARAVGQQVFEALAYLHRKMITHRDIKPDNILIANDSVDGFCVKLSDFGLSKVVKDNDTFLKTFCGTLLYCAPEVFPHYDKHLAANGLNKRKDRKVMPQKHKYHSYSQSVDIWSFGGVLWYAMCLKPPFEGVADANGKGMFDMIMNTRLDTDRLRQRGISEPAIDLLLQMLNTDPSERPTPQLCLVHDWFRDGPEPSFPDAFELALNTIDEEEEVEEGAAADLSQLSLKDPRLGAKGVLEELSIGSSDFEYFNPRQSKRFKTEPRPHVTAASQPEGPRDNPPKQHLPVQGYTQAESRPPLFGEVCTAPAVQPATGSSGIFGFDKGLVAISEEYSHNSSVYATSETGHAQMFASAMSRLHGNEHEDLEHALADHELVPGSSSLEGAESNMRDLNMDSPSASTNSPSGEISEPQTPRTPENPPQASLGQSHNTSDETPKPPEATPREPKYNRQISLPIFASHFYDANDPKTHTLEYASSITGHDFTANPIMPAESFHSLPPTIHAGSETSSSFSAPSSEFVASLQPDPEADFTRPAPRLGRMASTTNSFHSIVLNISSRVTTWGRASGNTYVYPDQSDTRIPKHGFSLYFHAKGIKEAEQDGDDWTKLPGLHCLISTGSSQGIRVNGVKLMVKDTDGKRMYGKVYTGDIITIFSGSSKLEFECEFFQGEGKQRRSENMESFRIEKE